MDDRKLHLGGCLCGKIRYSVEAVDGNAYHCHCHFCQRLTGAPYLIEHCFTQHTFAIVEGEPEVYTHVSGGSGRDVYVHFCGECGSKIYLSLGRWTETRNIFTGTLDDPSALDYSPRTLRQLFLDSAQSGTTVGAGYEIFKGHCDPADETPAESTVFDQPFTIPPKTAGGENGPHTGGCLCGDVRYEARQGPVAIVMCHCRFCQKVLGGAVNMECLFEKDSFSITKGTPSSYSCRSEGSGKMVTTHFCGRCGAGLWLTGERFPEVGVYRGSLDAPDRVFPSPENAVQIFYCEGLPSSMVAADIPTYERHTRDRNGDPSELTVFSQAWRIGEGQPA